jgi:hypothetical protein
MTVEQLPNHLAVIDTWEEKTARGLSVDQQILLLEKGIHAVEKRALKTLSLITLTVVLDRALNQSKEKFTILQNAKIDSGVSILKLLEDKDNQSSEFRVQSSENLLKALQYFLETLMTILTRITADILTIPIHKALQEVTWNDPENI